MVRPFRAASFIIAIGGREMTRDKAEMLERIAQSLLPLEGSQTIKTKEMPKQFVKTVEYFIFTVKKNPNMFKAE